VGCVIIRFREIPTKAKPYILDGFRKASRYSSLYKDCLKKARNESSRFKKDGSLARRLRVEYKCNTCMNMFSQKDINVDHINPVVPLDKSINDMTLGEYYRGCFTDVLQVLCKPCHKLKTKEEGNMRSKIRSLKIHKNMTEDEKDRGYELVQAIVLTEIIANRCKVQSDLDMHVNAIKYYKKQLKELETRYKEKQNGMPNRE